MLSSIKTNRNLVVMTSTIAVNVLFTFTWNPLLPLHLRALGASDWELGISFTLMGIARTLFAVVGGTLADRFGRRMMLTVPQFLTALLYLAAGATTNWVALVAILVVANALNALVNPAFNAIIAESMPEDRAARAFSLSEASVLVGLFAGPLLGAALLPYFSIPILLSGYGLILLLTSAVRFVGIVEPPRPIRVAAPKLHTVLDARVIWYVVAFGMTQMAFNICFGPYFAILARDAWGNSESEINLLFALGSAASFIGIPLGQRADHWGIKRVVNLGLTVFALSVAAWGIAPTWQWGLVPLVLAWFFSEAAIIALLAMQAHITTRETRGSVMGFISTGSGILGGLGPTIAAGLIAWGGNALPFIACGVMSLIAMGVLRGTEKRAVRVPAANRA